MMQKGLKVKVMGFVVPRVRDELLKQAQPKGLVTTKHLPIIEYDQALRVLRSWRRVIHSS